MPNPFNSVYDMGCEGNIMKWSAGNTQPSKSGITKMKWYKIIRIGNQNKNMMLQVEPGLKEMKQKTPTMHSPKKSSRRYKQRLWCIWC